MLINNNNSNFSICQLNIPRTSFTKKERSNFIIKIRNFSKKYKSNLNEHIRFTDRYVKANPSHERLADQSDSHRRTTIRFQKEAEKANIYRFIRSKYKTNVIIANPILFDYELRIMLQKEFDAFRALPMVKHTINTKNVTLINTKNLYNKELLNVNIFSIRRRTQMTDFQKIIVDKIQADEKNRQIIEKMPESVLRFSYKEAVSRIKNPERLQQYFMKIVQTQYGRYLTNPDRYEPKAVRSFKSNDYKKEEPKRSEYKVIPFEEETEEQKQKTIQLQKNFSKFISDHLKTLQNPPITNDNVAIKHITHEVKKDSSTVNFEPIYSTEQYDQQEEVFD